jgi:hypothetical protein
MLLVNRKTHCTPIKYFLNPILRILGFSIVSCFSENGRFIKYKIRRYPEYCKKKPIELMGHVVKEKVA